MSHRPGMKPYLPILTAIAGTAFLLLTCAPVSWADSVDDKMRETLRGLPGVYVLVESLDPEAQREGLGKAQIQTDVELRLRQSRIRVLTREESFSTTGIPFLYVQLSTLRHPSGLYAYSIRVGVSQEVVPVRQPTQGSHLAETWHTIGSFGIVGANKVSQLRKDVLDEVDQFINAFLAVNPR